MLAGIIGVLLGPAPRAGGAGAMRVRRLKRGEGRGLGRDPALSADAAAAGTARDPKTAMADPSEFARVLPATELSPLVEDLTCAYIEFRFGGKRDAAPRMVRYWTA